jgi:tRNA splicing ligase
MNSIKIICKNKIHVTLHEHESEREGVLKDILADKLTHRS